MKKIILLTVLIFISLIAKPQSGDCPGLCISSGGTYTATSGTSLELTAANRGCLIAGEASSSFWFQICFTSNGTFQFYMDPGGNRNDFDFAIWNNTTCPPTTSPIRCSWAAVPPGGPCATCDYTGLGNGATDLSEGASGNGWLLPLTVTTGQCITININNYGSGSNNFTINLTGTTAGISCPIPLPIELSYFKGTPRNEYNIISWATLTETNNDYFSLEKSTNGEEWNVIYTVEGEGNSNTLSLYEYKDPIDISNLLNYYRLKQVDFNGESKYSEIIAVNNSILEKKLVRRYNTLAQDVDEYYMGLYFELYDDGTIEKIWKY